MKKVKLTPDMRRLLVLARKKKPVISNLFSCHFELAERRSTIFATALEGKSWLHFPWSTGSGRYFPAEGWRCCRWVGRWRRCLAVCRTEGNFTAATGVASNVINLNARKECVRAIGTIRLKEIQQQRYTSSGNWLVCPVASLAAGIGVLRFFNSWNTFFFLLNFVARVLVFTLLWWSAVGTTELAKSQPKKLFFSPVAGQLIDSHKKPPMTDWTTNVSFWLFRTFVTQVHIAESNRPFLWLSFPLADERTRVCWHSSKKGSRLAKLQPLLFNIRGFRTRPSISFFSPRWYFPTKQQSWSVH